MTPEEKDALVLLVQVTHGVLVRRTGDGKNWFCNNGKCMAVSYSPSRIKHVAGCLVGLAIGDYEGQGNSNGW